MADPSGPVLSEARVGLLGVGLLGRALAQRLLAAGYSVTGYDPDGERRRDLRELGGEPVEEPAALIERCRRSVVCLPDSSVTARLLPVLERLAAGSLVIDCTTGAPDEMESFAARLAARGVGYLDATVAGSSAQVARGEAVLMVGARAELLPVARDLLEAIAPRLFHVGPPGYGARFKLAVNLVLGLNRLALAEGLAFAESCGLEPTQVLEVLRASPAYSRVMDTKGRRMIEGDYEPEARLRQHHKDVLLILREAALRGIELPASALHERLLAEAEARGWAEVDNSAIRELYRSRRRS